MMIIYYCSSLIFFFFFFEDASCNNKIEDLIKIELFFLYFDVGIVIRNLDHTILF